MQWSDVINDPSLRDLPYKIELDAQGRIVMSPASNRHGIQQGKLVRLLAGMLGDGEIATECSTWYPGGGQSGRCGVDVARVLASARRYHTLSAGA